jgi:hypothetical protein
MGPSPVITSVVEICEFDTPVPADAFHVVSMTSLHAPALQRSADFFESEATRLPRLGLVHVIIHQPKSAFNRLTMVPLSFRVIS